jgi:hypothetical protein
LRSSAATGEYPDTLKLSLIVEYYSNSNYSSRITFGATLSGGVPDTTKQPIQTGQERRHMTKKYLEDSHIPASGASVASTTTSTGASALLLEMKTA